MSLERTPIADLGAMLDSTAIALPDVASAFIVHEKPRALAAGVAVALTRGEAEMEVFSALLAFTLAATLVTITPGIDTALVLHTAAREGAAAAWRTGLGIAAGCLAWGALAAIGLSAALLASSVLFTALKLAGAAYLIWLGVTQWLRPAARPSNPGETRGSTPFRRGLLTNLLNPKVGLFYVAFLPQFIPVDADVLPMTLAMAAIHAALGLAWFALLIGATRTVAPWLARPAVGCGLDRLTGGLFVVLGAKLALDAR